MSNPASLPPVAAAGQAPLMRLDSDRHFDAGVNLSTWAIARRLPRTLAEAGRLGWRTDRRALAALLGCQAGAPPGGSDSVPSGTVALRRGDQPARGRGSVS